MLNTKNCWNAKKHEENTLKKISGEDSHQRKSEIK